MQVRTLFFASFRDAIGASEAIVELDDGSSVSDLLDHLLSEHSALAPVRNTVAVAVNQEYAALDAPLADGDEVALIPPVAGG